MKGPLVTPIFPKNNGHSNLPENMPIRRFDTRKATLNSAGFYDRFNPQIAHSIHHGHVPPYSSPSATNQEPLNCVTIAQHIETCPICSRLYDTDKTLYILAIIGLLILCFLMAKRIVKL